MREEAPLTVYKAVVIRSENSEVPDLIPLLSSDENDDGNTSEGRPFNQTTLTLPKMDLIFNIMECTQVYIGVRIR